MLNNMESLMNESDLKAISFSLRILAGLATITALYFATAIAAPVILALVVGVILSPALTLADRLRLPKAATALACLFAVLAFATWRR